MKFKLHDVIIVKKDVEHAKKDEQGTIVYLYSQGDYEVEFGVGKGEERVVLMQEKEIKLKQEVKTTKKKKMGRPISEPIEAPQAPTIEVEPAVVSSAFAEEAPEFEVNEDGENVTVKLCTREDFVSDPFATAAVSELGAGDRVQMIGEGVACATEMLLMMKAAFKITKPIHASITDPSNKTYKLTFEEV